MAAVAGTITVDPRKLKSVKALYQAVKDAIEDLDLEGVGDPTDLPEAAVNKCEGVRDDLINALREYQEA
jgi:hypothetical protein